MKPHAMALLLLHCLTSPIVDALLRRLTRPDCELPIYDGARLTDADFQTHIREQHAVLLSNLTDGWPALVSWADTDLLLRRYGDVEVPVRDGGRTAHYGSHMFAADHVMTIRAFLETDTNATGGGHGVVFDTTNRWRVLEYMRHDFSLPAILKPIFSTPVFSLARPAPMLRGRRSQGPSILLPEGRVLSRHPRSGAFTLFPTDPHGRRCSL